MCLSIVTHEHDTIASRYVLSMRSPNVLRQMHGQRGGIAPEKVVLSADPVSAVVGENNPIFA